MLALRLVNGERESALQQNDSRRSRCVSQYPSELTQALRNFLTATRDSSPAMMPSSQIGLVGTGGFTGIVADCEVDFPDIASRL